MTFTGMVVILEGVVIENPYISLAIISFLVTMFSTLAQKWLTNQEHMKSLKTRQKEIQKVIRSSALLHIRPNHPRFYLYTIFVENISLSVCMLSM